MASTTTMTGAAFDQLPYEEGRNLELLQGEVIEVSTPTPRHQRIAGRILYSLYAYFDREPIGEVLQESEFALGDDNRLQPDLAVVLGDSRNSIDPDRTPIPLVPAIAMEVISPVERAIDSMRKVWTYLSAGTLEVWQFYPGSGRVLIHRSAEAIAVLSVGQSLSTPLLPGWEIPVGKVFEV
ncbi:MAG TPA: Uma2 family endonuclease [Bryobacteraceae bacterium]|nr:Uma2 family endonuclease [Bryobacteraceae bacterium]